MVDKKYLRDKDLVVYKEEIEDFIPRKIFDFHIHVWQKGHLLKACPQEPEKTIPGSHLEECSFESLESVCQDLFPGVLIQGLVFGLPFKGMNINMMNEYVSGKIKNEKGKYAGLLIPRLEAGTEELISEIEKGCFSGFKPYYTQVENKTGDEIRINDFVTKAQLETADDKELIILLHIPKKARIADPVNIEDIIDICVSYPKARIVLAHIGRSYGPYFLEKAIDKIKGLGNLYYDLAMVNDGRVIDLLLENVGSSKVLYGTDIPIALEKGKHICVNKQCLFITEKKFPWSISGQGLECTYFVYEGIRAIKWAAKRRKLSLEEIENIFYNNAKGLLE